QSYNLLPTMTATENVAMPLMFSAVKQSVRDKKAKQMLKRVGLEHRLSHKPTQMSGGQQQRVAIARAPLSFGFDFPWSNQEIIKIF
ncbi:MAG: ATP-binding cassette domain-containing protein, partial [Alistipes sp.]|nr:ATP-binding cassette domain-containing protein [Alistipes sp.]